MPRPAVNLIAALIALLCALALAALMPGRADAVNDSEELARFGGKGSQAGQTGFGDLGMATDPLTGELFVSDSENKRVDVFSAWGNFVRAFGWGVADGKEELESCTAASGCRAGLTGAGEGQFASPGAIAVGSGGRLYVQESFNHRVQKFDSSGQFVLMFGGDVNKTKVEEAGSTQAERNLCTAASGDLCQAGSQGGGPGEFSEGTGIAIDKGGAVLVGDDGRIEEFEPSGAFKSQIAMPAQVRGVAVDPVSDEIYTILNSTNTAQNDDDVRKFSAAGNELGSLQVHQPSKGRGRTARAARRSPGGPTSTSREKAR